MPKLDGKTLIALDVSGSMGCVSDIAALFAAVFLKSNDCDLITFDDRARYVFVNTTDSVMTIKNSLRFHGGGTNFESVFKTANKAYDRVVLLSDMQAWVENHWCRSPKQAYELYKKQYEATNCKFYSIDLAGYGTLQLPQADVCCMAGFSEKIFDIMKNLEADKYALVNTINKIEL